MTTQFIINDKGERTTAIVPINEYENLLHQHHIELELSEEYKSMIDEMLEKEEKGESRYVSLETIRSRFEKG